MYFIISGVKKVAYYSKDLVIYREVRYTEVLL